MIAEESLQIILDRLEERGISYMITGSFASNVHGIPRATQDADVIFSIPDTTEFDFDKGIFTSFPIYREIEREGVAAF